MWLSWCHVSRLVFPVKIFLLIGTSRWMQGLSHLATRPESNSESWPTDSLKSMHSFTYTIRTAGAPALLPCGRPWGGRKKRQRSPSEFCVPQCEDRWDHRHAHLWTTTASPPHILNTHSLPHSFIHSVGAVNRDLCGHWRFSYERTKVPGLGELTF